METTRPADHAARKAIERELDTSFLVEAAAGTGKTTVLVRRVLETLASGRAEVDRIVAVTFTEKAAGELKLRLRAEIDAAMGEERRAATERQRLERALARLEEAQVGTIHGFCAEILRDHPVEAALDPLFSPMTEAEARRLFRGTLREWIAESGSRLAPGVRRALRRRSRSAEASLARLEAAGWALAAWRDFDAPWQRPAPWNREAAIHSLLQRVLELREALHAGGGRGARGAAARLAACLDRFEGRTRALRQARPADLDGLEAELVNLAADGDWRWPVRELQERETSAESARSVTAVAADLAAFARDADADLAASLQAELRTPLERYAHAKRRQGRLDFHDLLLEARGLLRSHRSVRDRLRARFQRLFVDEFQDTDPLQTEILLLLGAAPGDGSDWRDCRPGGGRIFLVGDPKQSIYRFRRAGAGIYEEARQLLLQRGVRLVRLTTSFRSRPSLQRFVNAAFAPVMDGDRAAEQPSYVPLEPWRDERPSQPSLVALPVPEPHGASGRVTAGAVEESCPDAVAAFVDWLLHKSGWQVSESGAGRPVPVQPHHVCVLFRRFESFRKGDVTRAYVMALLARGIPHLLVGGRTFHEREEIGTLRAALAAIEWPDDERAVFSTLRGSLFAIDDETLLVYRHRHRRLDPLRPRGGEDGQMRVVAEALAFLGELHRRRTGQPVADTIHELLRHTRAHAGFALRPAGEQALANVLYLAELAREYEREGGRSFRGFVQRLAEDAAQGRAPEAPLFEQGSEGVRLMTVHRAKGLEFPVVVLADPTARIAGHAPTRTVDAGRGLCALRLAGWAPLDLLRRQEVEAARDRAEGVRVAYVAATRARDLLAVPVVAGHHWRDGWLGPIEEALDPRRGARRAARPAGCPEFGKESPAQTMPAGPTAPSVAAGAWRFAGGYEVVWWDPSTLALRRLPRLGVRQRPLLDKNAEERIVREGVERFRAWEARRARVREQGARPSVVVLRASELPEDAAVGGDDLPVERLATAAHGGGGSGAAFGTLLHACLAVVPLDAGAAAVERLCAHQARLLGCGPVEAEAARDRVLAALAHPAVAGAREAADCRREVPVVARLADGTVIEGVVDLAWRTAAGWTVVEYKTGPAEPPARRHEAQVRAYVEALRGAGEPVRRAVLLFV